MHSFNGTLGTLFTRDLFYYSSNCLVVGGNKLILGGDNFTDGPVGLC